jgi:toxin ParE1/3/4
MSSRDLALILSPRAEADFTDILSYTFATWGEAQMFTYRAILDKALMAVLDNPQIGHACPELSAKHRIFSAGRHIIVYYATDKAVCVSRILHERMDVKRRM